MAGCRIEILFSATKTLVGLRNQDKQVLRLTIRYEVGKLPRVLCSFLPGLIRRGPCLRLYKQTILKGFPGNFYRSHYYLAKRTKGRLRIEDARFLFPPQPEAVAQYLISKAWLCSPG